VEMEKRRSYTTLHIYDFGPFKEAHVELAPLTIFIGKNSLGKSMLLYLIWVLETTLPDFDELYKAVDEMSGIKLAENCLSAMKEGREIRDSICKTSLNVYQKLSKGMG